MTQKNILSGQSDKGIKDQVFADQIRLLYENTAFGCSVQAIVILTLAVAQKDFAPETHIALILGYFAVVILARLYLNRVYKKTDLTPSQTQKWANYQTIAVASSGLGWVFAAYIFITTPESANVIFTALILGGISSGGLISLAVHLPTYYVLLFPTMLSGIVLYIQIGTNTGYYTAALGILLLTFLFFSARKLNTMLVSNLSLTIEYKFLFSDLANEKKTTDLLNENLKSEINERRSAEEKSHQAMENAERANKAKTEFLSSMSHELRTPLNAIMGYGQLLEHSNKDLKQTKYVEEILRGGRLLLALINQVLDLAKIEHGQMEIEIESIKPQHIISDAMALVEIQAAKLNIKLLSHPPKGELPHIKVDSTRVLQVMLNILSNAIKYNNPNGQVTVSVKEIGDELAGQYVRITVADTGIGIPAESHDVIFEPFSRLPHQNGHIEGTGIGLSICKLLIELMDGKIGFQSNEGDGSVFWIDLPVDLTYADKLTVKAQGTSAG